MGHLILLRHGQSEWNKKNIFTGWVDIPLSKEGMDEAVAAASKMRGIKIDLVFCSTLIRAMQTAMLLLLHYEKEKTPAIIHDMNTQEGKWGKSENTSQLLPIYCHASLNERMYGSLQGLNKDETRKQYGAEQVKLWRRSYEIAPPQGESLKMTLERTLPYFESAIVPKVQEGKNVLVSAHGNSLRAIVAHLKKLDDKQILNLEIATGEPLIFEYTEKGFTHV